MGLSGQKKRGKLSQDPNNTAWSRSTSNFGHKILTAQGWKPGDFLGAKDASHADHYTAANASHIRVMLREDNLGLGAQIGGKGNAETFGLSMFSGILGRLNGKDEGEVKKQEAYQRDAELRTYQSQKYGFMNFVRGGLLLGDKMDFPKDPRFNKTDESKVQSREDRKRKESEDSTEPGAQPRLKKKQKKSDLKAEAVPNGASSALHTSTEDSQPTSESDALKSKLREASVRRKEERRARKAAKSAGSAEDLEALQEAKRARKEERRKKKRADTGKEKSTSPKESEAELTKVTEVKNNAAPAFVGRQAVRQRYIQQKRMASMNAQALKEIFMLPTAA